MILKGNLYCLCLSVCLHTHIFHIRDITSATSPSIFCFLPGVCSTTAHCQYRDKSPTGNAPLISCVLYFSRDKNAVMESDLEEKRVYSHSRGIKFIMARKTRPQGQETSWSQFHSHTGRSRDRKHGQAINTRSLFRLWGISPCTAAFPKCSLTSPKQCHQLRNQVFTHMHHSAPHASPRDKWNA